MRSLHFPVLCAGAAVVIGVLVFMAFGRSHTKVVTKVQTREVNARYNGTISSLVEFMHPVAGGQVKCDFLTGVPKNTSCYRIDGQKYLLLVAMPADPGAS